MARSKAGARRRLRLTWSHGRSTVAGWRAHANSPSVAPRRPPRWPAPPPSAALASPWLAPALAPLLLLAKACTKRRLRGLGRPLAGRSTPWRCSSWNSRSPANSLTGS